ncbi:MAG: RagB/SusD family nutrient uptake outer membrane protein, partial [Marinoscillum sp.]
YHYNQSEASTVGWVNTQLSSLNVHLLRYSEVLLLLAEAEANLNNLPRAMELVNMIRSRAGNCAQGPATSLDAMKVDPSDPVTTWADYNVGTYSSFPNQEYALEAIQWERRLELAMEGHRFFDLRRWGIAQEVMNEYFAEEATKRAYLSGYTQYDPSVHSYYPLPAFQVDLSKVGGEAQLRQVPGWE